jgi:hypothetical protein
VSPLHTLKPSAPVGLFGDGAQKYLSLNEVMKVGPNPLTDIFIRRGKSREVSSRQVGGCEPSKETSGETKPSNTLTLDSQPPQL